MMEAFFILKVLAKVFHFSLEIRGKNHCVVLRYRAILDMMKNNFRRFAISGL